MVRVINLYMFYQNVNEAYMLEQLGKQMRSFDNSAKFH